MIRKLSLVLAAPLVALCFVYPVHAALIPTATCSAVFNYGSTSEWSAEMNVTGVQNNVIYVITIDGHQFAYTEAIGNHMVSSGHVIMGNPTSAVTADFALNKKNGTTVASCAVTFP